MILTAHYWRVSGGEATPRRSLNAIVEDRFCALVLNRPKKECGSFNIERFTYEGLRRTADGFLVVDRATAGHSMQITIYHRLDESKRKVPAGREGQTVDGRVAAYDRRA
jgi:hypothetical protein